MTKYSFSRQHGARPASRAFTLIELLTVISIIGILAGIMIPTIGGVMTRAKKARSRVTMGQWANGMELYKSEYGFYAPVDGSYASSGGNPYILNSQKFAVAMTGRLIDGTELPASASTSDKVNNVRKQVFYSITQSELDTEKTPPMLHDAFGNTEIAVMYDKNGDGLIRVDDVTKAPGVAAVGGGRYTPDVPNDFDLTLGIHAGVVFYSAGAGNADNSEIDESGAIFSWK